MPASNKTQFILRQIQQVKKIGKKEVPVRMSHFPYPHNWSNHMSWLQLSFVWRRSQRWWSGLLQEGVWLSSLYHAQTLSNSISKFLREKETTKVARIRVPTWIGKERSMKVVPLRLRLPSRILTNPVTIHKLHGSLPQHVRTSTLSAFARSHEASVLRSEERRVGKECLE